jgi:hypothetical protein
MTGGRRLPWRLVCGFRGTAGPSAPLRSGRDDTSVWVLRVCHGEFGRAEGRTADPSTSLPRISCGSWWRCRTSCAFPLQKGAHAALSSEAWQEIRVGMTKGRGVPPVEIGLWIRGTAGPSTSLRSGRDDTSVWVLRVCSGEFGGPMRALQIPRLRFPGFLWKLVALSHFMRLSLTERRTRGLVQRSVAGNPGRDDKGEGGAFRGDRFVDLGAQQVPPLRSG